MATNQVIQYGINFVVSVVTPKNIFKVLIAANKPLQLVDIALKSYTKTLVTVAPLMAAAVASASNWSDALFPIGLVNKAINLLVGNIKKATNLMGKELALFGKGLTRAFNARTAITSINALRVAIIPVVQQASLLGGTWESTTNLIVDNARAVGVMSAEYALYASQVAKFAKSEEMIASVTNAATNLAQTTGVVLPADMAILVDQMAKLTSVTRLASNEVETYGQALTAITSQLPVTVDYLSMFTTNNAMLIRSNQLSIEQVTAYGAAFEQLGVKANNGSAVFQKLINLLQTPDGLLERGSDGFAQLGFTIEEVNKLTQGEGGLNNALQTLLLRIQGIANTDPSAAIEALSSLLGEDSNRGAGAQTILALANNLGSLNNALQIMGETTNNEAIAESLYDIASQANPMVNLQTAMTGLSETFGTILRPLVITIAQDLANLVNGISGFFASNRTVITATIKALIIFSRLLDYTLRILAPLTLAWTVFNATVVTTKVIAIGLAHVTRYLLAQNMFGLAVATGFASRQMHLFYVFLSTKFLASLKAVSLATINALPATIWSGFINLVKQIPVLFNTLITSARTFLTMLGGGLRSLFPLIAPFLPLIITITLAILATRAAWLTFVATMKKANAIRKDIESIKTTGDEVSKSFKAIGINADGSLVKTIGVWGSISQAASDAMEAIRDNALIFEHIGKLIGNQQLAQFKLATQEEASANQAAIAYGDLLQTIDSYGETYSQVVAKVRENPNDYKTLTAGNNLLELLRKQQQTLESIEVTKDQAASKAAYLQSLDQQIRYVSKLTVGNDELANSIDQAEVSVENLEQTLDNLRSKVGDERSKEVQKEIDLLTESAAKVEEVEKAKVEAVEETAKQQFDAQEKTIKRQEQLADRQLDRARAKEDAAIQQRQASEDKAIEERYDKEDERYQESFDKKEAAIEKQLALEQAAIEKQQAAEDKAIEKRSEAEDKAIERQQAAEDKAITKRQEIEDKSLAAQLDKELAAIADRTAAAEAAINAEAKLRDEALSAQLDRELAAVDAGLTAREEALAAELATREAAANKLGETTTNNLEAQQQTALQSAEAAFNAQQRAIDAAYQQRKQGIEQAHSNKLTQQETTAKQRLLQLEDQFNTRLIDKQLAAVEQRKAKELASVSSREDAALKAFDRQQQLQNADSPEDRAKLQAEFEQTDKLEAQRQAIRDKYDAERSAKEAEAEKAKLALEAEKAKKEQELAEAKKQEEEKAALEKAKIEAEQAAALEKLELEKEAAKAERQAVYEKQQEEIKLAFETKLLEVKTATENTINELKLANEKAIETLKQEAEAKRNELTLANEKLLESNKLATEEKINQLKLAADQEAEKLQLQHEADAEQRSLKREADAEQRELAREQAAEQLKEQRELEAEQRKLQREVAATARAEQIESAKEARAERFEDAKARREEQRESAKESRDKQREEAAYQRQLRREDEDYERQLARDAEGEARQEAFDAAKAERDKAYDAAKAERDKVLAEQVADREAALARELEIIKLQTQSAIEQSYGEIVDKLRASAEAISAAARASNAAAAPTPTPGKRYRGGIVKAGMPYWVGEDRRTGQLTPNSELFIPRSAGYIANASQVWGMIRATNRIRANYIPTPPKQQQALALAPSPAINEILSIKADVKRLAKAVNPRTNRLNTNTNQPQTKTSYVIN